MEREDNSTTRILRNASAFFCRKFDSPLDASLSIGKLTFSLSTLSLFEIALWSLRWRYDIREMKRAILCPDARTRAHACIPCAFYDTLDERIVTNLRVYLTLLPNDLSQVRPRQTSDELKNRETQQKSKRNFFSLFECSRTYPLFKSRCIATNRCIFSQIRRRLYLFVHWFTK